MNNLIRTKTLSDIVETGSNANGTFVKYRNGIMESWGTITPASNDNSGTTYTFPQPFVTAPMVVAQAKNISSSGLGSSSITEHSGTTATTVLVKALAHSASAIVNITNGVIEVHATGKWTSIYDSSMPTISIGRGIIESGSNANGSYIKYEDGTMMQWITNKSSDIVAGLTRTFTLTFPQPFADTNYTMTHSYYENSSGIGSYNSYPSLKTTTGMTYAMYVSIDNGIAYADFFLIGRWQSATNMVGEYTFGQGIIETGSNSNGNWIKFDNGTMMAYATPVSCALTAYGSQFRKYRQVFILPQEFYSIQNIIPSHMGSGNTSDSYGFSYQSAVVSMSQVNINVLGWTSETSYHTVAVVGRWKS